MFRFFLNNMNIGLIAWLLLGVVHAQAKTLPMVGFFTPGGVPHELIHKMPVGMMNVTDISRVRQVFKQAEGSAFRISIDFGPALTSARPALTSARSVSELSMQYQDGNGKTRVKLFEPPVENKLRTIPSDGKIRAILAPYLDVLALYPSNVGPVFLADEPYLNGISKMEMERLARIVRQELDKRKLTRIELGVVFAAGMFNKDFAALISRQAGVYVAGIDDYFLRYRQQAGNSQDFKQWVKNIKENRLVTYDRAGNMYTGGGLPKGFDVVGFDFYLSTLLLDNLHENTLAWLAVRYPQHGCGQFANQTMSRIRSNLSFFQDGIVKQGHDVYQKDKLLLDAIFDCRMGAITDMLVQASGKKPIKFLMYSESSNNGVLEFDSKGVPEQGQPEKLVEARALDEAIRAQRFYLRNASKFSAGLMYFTYQNEYDYSIKLNIGGASAMPTVLKNILDFAKTPMQP